MKLTLRFLLPVLAALALLAYALVPFVEHLMEVWSVRDLNIRSILIGKTVGPDLQRLLVAPEDVAKNKKKLQAALVKATEDERLLALQICDSRQKILMKTDNFPEGFACSTMDREPAYHGKLFKLPAGSIHFSYAVIDTPE
ncbi:MAG: hypothetical protein M3Q07_17175, partial [Pseudobdellovibrionaceae bacterium]|nr:hypothetical protein [Pseudobdellovibrionaceae bacterium]